MKLDKIKFARLIAFVQQCSNRGLEGNEIGHIDNLIDIDVTPIEVPGKANPQDVNELMRLMVSGGQVGSKIEAIKAYRTITGCMLKESKDAVEKYWVKNETEEQPARLKDIIGDRGSVNFDKFEG